VTSVFSLIMAGPRVYARMADDGVFGGLLAAVRQPEDEFAQLAPFRVELRVAVRVVPEKVAAQRVLTLEHVALLPRPVVIESIFTVAMSRRS
jgi:hypothetical protein